MTLTLRRLFRGDFLLTLWLSIGWQVALLCIGFFIAPQQGLFGHMNHWDAGWYLHIIQHAYSLEGSPAAPAFYPLFPLVIGGLKFLTFGAIPVLAIAFVVNTMALWAALLALVKILKYFKVSRSGVLLGILAFLAFPSAFFMHTFYSEALFIAIGFWAYYFSLKRKWWAVGILLAALTAARLPSLLFVALCGLEYLSSYKWDIKKALNKRILWFLLAPIGFISYGLYLLLTRQDFLAMFHAYTATNDWTYQVFNINILATLFDSSFKIVSSVGAHQFNYEIFVNHLLPIIAVVSIVTASIYILITLKKRALPLFLFGILAVVLFTLNSNIVSVHRYALACIVIYIAISVFITRHPKWIIPTLLLIGVSCVTQLFLYAKFTSGVFAG